MTGRLAPILTAERTALNFLGHLSGVATLTATFVDAVADAGGSLRVWDTRKTTPGLRSLEKAAVRAGGGANHRGNLSDWVLLKDNHLALFGIADAVARARARWPGRTVHVECDDLDQVRQAVAAGADALLLDNMTPDEVRAVVAEVRAADPAAPAARGLGRGHPRHHRAATPRPAPTWSRSAPSPTRPRCSTSASTSCPDWPAGRRAMLRRSTGAR